MRLARTAGDPLRPEDIHLFPIIIRWDLWQQVFVPVLREQKIRKGLGNFDSLMAQIQLSLTEQLKLKGFLPTDPVASTPDSLPETGEPVTRGDQRGDDRYPIQDASNLNHLEGNPKIEYALVDGGPKGTR